MEAQSLYKDVVACERLLRESLKKGQAYVASDPLRTSLLEKALIFTLKYPSFSASKETEQVLWKPCFYKCIEYFRRSIRKYAAASNADHKIREHFFRVSLEFQSFLDAAAVYYEKLHDAFAAQGSNDANLRQSMFRCLIFLGDIARYRELHSQKAKKNFATAETFYHRALAVMPENGNPHNQLAVLATYIEAETIAVYRYCRSLLVPQPFVTSEENLVLLFERAKQRAIAPSTTPITMQSSPKDKSAFLKSFLHRLTRLHGSYLFPSPQSEYPLLLEDGILQDFDLLLQAGVMGDALLLKLCAINMFCVFRRQKEDSCQVLPHAVRLTLLLMTRTLNYVVSRPEKQMLLGPISILCDFFQPRFDLLSNVNEPIKNAFFQSLIAIPNSICPPDAIKLAGCLTLDLEKMSLKESIELRCFEPLDGGRIPASSLDVLPENEALNVRCANIYRFCKALTQPTGNLGIVYLYLVDNTFTLGPPSSHEDDEDDFEDEVIVFQPLNPTTTNNNDALSFGGADFSAFKHLGNGVGDFAVTSVPKWGEQKNVNDRFWSDLDAVEEEGSRYEHQVSSLSMFFQPDKKKQPPPGFEASVVTQNPFFLVGNTS
ncbi:hypothetical protein THRCLA_09897 [Thraustotheca clavata]|uniref:Telomerase-binding protein EST1A n=1 Tax=Thraustotheca clavata TaxID=74557 RepID=A0A1V9YU75_9STRA|nr:hypothetical protein THRCLA_09897 [Thraustotheca clavata]